MSAAKKKQSKSRAVSVATKARRPRRSATRKDPQGGLTAAGRRFFAEKEGAAAAARLAAKGTRLLERYAKTKPAPSPRVSRGR